jgi:hypothetical protein
MTWKFAGLLALAACSGKGGETFATADAIGATGWGDNVAITPGDGSFRYVSDGYPNHSLNAEYIMPDDMTPCVPHPTADCSHIEPLSTAIEANGLDLTITTTPQLVDDPTSSPFGSMGVMISGVTVYNPYEGDGTTIAMNANFTLKDDSGADIPFMDSCNGHPAPHPLAAYHYHGLPSCVTAQVDEDGGPSHIIGYGFDGFPIYGDRDAEGAVVDPATLDECNGIDSATPEFPDGIYHYVLLEVATEQSTVRCLHGRLDAPLATFQFL